MTKNQQAKGKGTNEHNVKEHEEKVERLRQGSEGMEGHNLQEREERIEREEKKKI